jgi:hypothetical protein
MIIGSRVKEEREGNHFSCKKPARCENRGRGREDRERKGERGEDWIG